MSDTFMEPATMSEELYLRPVRGIPRLVGQRFNEILLRLLSMEEQKQAHRSGPLASTDGYFRRDRHCTPHVDPASYRLKVTKVARPRAFDLDELRALPTEERICVQECAGNGNHWMGSAGLMGQARWRGPKLSTILDACGGPGQASHFAAFGLDATWRMAKGYSYGLSLEELIESGTIVGLDMNGLPLSARHGFPARLISPRIYSMAHVKWLGRLEGRLSPHTGIQNTRIYVNKERRGGRWVKTQARWIGLKSLITRCVRDDHDWNLLGWGWGGTEPVTKVEVTTDAGQTWSDARCTMIEDVEQLHGLGAESFVGAATSFEYDWRPERSGLHRIGSRAFTESGAAQPLVRPSHVRGHFDQCDVKWRDVRVP